MKKSLFCSLLIMFIINGTAFAHVPIVTTYDKCWVRIPAPMEKSIAIYASFEKKGDVDKAYFRLDDNDFKTDITMIGIVEGQEGDQKIPLVTQGAGGVPGRRLHVGSLVPGCETYDGILPTIAIIGPVQDSLPAYNGSIALPGAVNIAADEGVYILSNTVQGPLWYEKFTFKSYYDQNNADLVITKPGTYTVYIWDSASNTGDYVLEVGYVEKFGFQEILQSMFWINHLVQDGEISCAPCKDQLEVIDGPNPTFQEMIDTFKEVF